jgi:Fe-S-cluster-containing hydrogenase component 2
MVGGRPEIDLDACTLCETCLEACPAGALERLEPVSVPVFMQPAAAGQELVPLPDPPQERPAPWLGATLAYLGQQAAPRLIDILLSALERRLVLAEAPESAVPQRKGQARRAAGRRGKRIPRRQLRRRHWRRCQG